jgi:hypothetical protein
MLMDSGYDRFQLKVSSFHSFKVSRKNGVGGGCMVGKTNRPPKRAITLQP